MTNFRKHFFKSAEEFRPDGDRLKQHKSYGKTYQKIVGFSCLVLFLGMTALTAVVVVVKADQGTQDHRIAVNNRTSLSLHEQQIIDEAKAQVVACTEVNKLRAQFLDFVQSAVVRSTAAAKATLASSTASPSEKQTAVKNLVGLVAAQQELRTTVLPEKCRQIPQEKP